MVFATTRQLFSLLTLLLLFHFSCSSTESLQTYIIHVQNPPDHLKSHQHWHETFLPKSKEDNSKSRLLYSYKHAISGFAVRLTTDELNSMSQMEGFLHARPNGVVRLATTHTPSFLNLDIRAGGFWRSTTGFGRGVIIGILDTGIFPSHPSFDDKNMPPPPAKWKGKCEFKKSLCNNKLIGARAFNLTSNVTVKPPFDDDGHGTHTASTVAGQFVKHASFLGNAEGIAAGIAPHAHLAIYKVCGERCKVVDVLAAVDAAIEDGVDVISMSMSVDGSVPLYNDIVAIASLGAVKKGVFVSAAAGNGGPYDSSVQNAAPWILSVGASTTDRRIRAVVKLGNGIEFEGESGYQPTNFTSAFLPLVYPESNVDYNSTYCTNRSSLEGIDVRGKIVLCIQGYTLPVEKCEVVKEAGGAGMILLRSGYDTRVYPFTLPASAMSYNYESKIKEYINSTSKPKATILFKGTVIGWSDAPGVASFSSRGPSSSIPGFVKPDIVGPGANILAAWPTPVGPFKVMPPFNMISGTSMSCPHLTGVVALLKSSHPGWSPAMIKSAIITTANTKNVGGEPIIDMWQLAPASFYEMGAGHVNPIKANYPGLVYDNESEDYVSYLCGLGYTDDQVTIINQVPTECSKVKALDSASLNYPSLVVDLNAYNSFSKQVFRTVTNVGLPHSLYTIKVIPPPGVEVVVAPEHLSFTEVGQKLEFSVSLAVDKTMVQQPSCTNLNGYYIWIASEASIQVSSPLVVKLC